MKETRFNEGVRTGYLLADTTGNKKVKTETYNDHGNIAKLELTKQLPEVYPSSQAELEHSNYVLRILQHKRATNDKTDVTISCHDEKELKAHRLVLLAASPYFSVLEDTKVNRFEFNAISLEDMTVVLDFIYSGKITLEDEVRKDKQRLMGVMRAAEKLQLPVLSKWCLHRLSDNIDFNNFQQVFTLAKECNNEGLTARNITFVVQNFTHIVRTKEIVKLDVEQMKRVLQHPELVQQCMDDVVRAIFRWVEFDPERKKHLSSLIQPLDLSYLSKSYLSTLMGSSLMKHDRDLLAILIGESTRRAMNPETNNANICKQGHQFVCFGKTDQNRVVRIYDIDSNEWLEPQEPPFLFERGTAMVGYGHHVFFFGGGGWPPNPTNTIVEFCPQSNVSSDSVGGLAVPTCRAGAIVFNDYVYVVNGVGRNMKRHNIVQRYNPRDGSCELVAPTIQSHFCPLGFCYNFCMYIVGVFNDDEKALECYDSLGNQWTLVTFIPGSIEWCRGAFSGTKLFIIRKKEDTTAQVYNMVSGEWSTIEFEVQGPPSNEWGCWAAKKAGRQMLFARWGDNVVHAYDVETMKWEFKSESNQNLWNYLLTCCVYR